MISLFTKSDNEGLILAWLNECSLKSEKLGY